jgi:hypothetical protein
MLTAASVSQSIASRSSSAPVSSTHQPCPINAIPVIDASVPEIPRSSAKKVPMTPAPIAVIHKQKSTAPRKLSRG